MQKTVEKIQKEFTDERGNQELLVYQILRENLPDSEGVPGCEMYGVQIKKIGEHEEEKQARGLTSSYSEVKEFVKRLADGLVTPVTLLDIVEDYIYLCKRG